MASSLEKDLSLELLSAGGRGGDHAVLDEHGVAREDAFAVHWNDVDIRDRDATRRRSLSCSLCGQSRQGESEQDAASLMKPFARATAIPSPAPAVRPPLARS